MTEAAARVKRRSSNKRGRTIPQLPWRQPENHFPLVELLTHEEVLKTHDNALRVLEEIGIRFQADEAVEIFASAGCIIGEDGMTVRIGREIVNQALKSVKSKVTLYPRNRERAVTIGGNHIAFASVLGPPYCSDLENGRRQGTLDDYCNFVRLGQYFNIIHMISGAPVEPMDIPLEFRHLNSTLKVLELSDKVPFVFCQGRQRIHDALDMIAMAKGIDRSGLVDEPSTFTIINSNSPLQYDKPMANGLIEMAKHNQLSMITPFSLAGASHPISLGAANSLAVAEMLAALTLTQLVRPGAPVASAAYTMNVNMQTGSPGFGSPETNKSLQIGSQMARFYGLPIRSSTFTSSPAPDAQAIYESLGMLWASITSGSNLIMHAAGWLEGGLRSSFEKFILDIEMLQMMAKYLEPVEVNDTTLAFEEIKSVGHGGHFFDTENTIKNYSTAFYEPINATAKNFGQWEEEGSLDATQRANIVYKKALNSYEEPYLETSTKEALEAFVIKREEQGGAPIDL